MLLPRTLASAITAAAKAATEVAAGVSWEKRQVAPARQQPVAKKAQGVRLGDGEVGVGCRQVVVPGGAMVPRHRNCPPLGVQPQLQKTE